MRRVILFLSIIFLLAATCVWADEVYLKNGDKLSGDILSDTDQDIQIQSEAVGVIVIEKQFIDNIISDIKDQEKDVQAEEEKVRWERKLSAGYSFSRGNTDKSQMTASLSLDRKTQLDQWTLRGRSSYSSANKKMDSQKWDASARYAFSFGKILKAYNFYRFEADHDRFSNIHYRLTPFAGVGYWFFDQPDVRWRGELGLGFEHTNYRNNQKDSSEGIIVPRISSEYTLIGDSKLAKDVSLYLPFNDVKSYRIKGQVDFINPIDEYLSFKISVIDDFDSNPSGGTSKNDLRFISSLVYSF